MASHKQYPGIVKTSRGRTINMNELKNRHTKPLAPPDAKSTVQIQAQPSKQMHVLGFMPDMAGVQQPPKMEGTAKPAILGQMAEPVAEGPAMADYTGIIVDRTNRERPDNAFAASNEIYHQIRNDLQSQLARKGLPPRSDQPRRSRSKT